MKTSLFILFLSGLLALVAAFTPEDHEIFRLRDEIEANEGPEVTFYGVSHHILSFDGIVLTTCATDFLGVKPSASQDDILKAFRKKSRILHPDKAKQSFIASRAKATSKPLLGLKNKKPGVHVNKAPSESDIQAAVKKASDRYARLTVIAEILKGGGRERYDHFLSNGFPKWRGTGYYYARFRPGLGTVLVGLFAFGGGLVHYGAMYISWQRQKDFVERYVRNARRSAWGDDSGIRGIPGVEGAMMGTSAASPSTLAQETGAAVLNRRQKREEERQAKKDAKNPKKSKGLQCSGTSTPLESETAEPVSGPQGAKKKVQAENGKWLIVDSVGNVFMEEDDENGVKGEFLLDPETLPKPTFRDTVLYKLPVWAFSKVKGRIIGAQANDEEAKLADLETTNEGGDTEHTEVISGKENGNARKHGKRINKA